MTLEKRIDPATPVITADKKRLTQILYNLVGNALKFTHKGSVTVEVKPDISGKQVQKPSSWNRSLHSITSMQVPSREMIAALLCIHLSLCMKSLQEAPQENADFGLDVNALVR